MFQPHTGKTLHIKFSLYSPVPQDRGMNTQINVNKEPRKKGMRVCKVDVTNVITIFNYFKTNFLAF